MNESGIIPIDRRVVVRPEIMDEVTEGGIYIPDEARDKEDMGHIKATIASVGAQAFEDIEDREYRPKPGMTISIARYAGYLMKGKDGKPYRIINDTDVVAVLDGEWDIRPKGLSI